MGFQLLKRTVGTTSPLCSLPAMPKSIGPGTDWAVFPRAGLTQVLVFTAIFTAGALR